MKKFLCIILSVALLTVGINAANADSDTELYERIAQMVNDNWDNSYISQMKLTIGDSNMIVNGEEKKIDKNSETAPIIMNDRTMLPIRAIVEEMGGDVEWDGSDKSISITKDETDINLIIDNDIMTVNNKEIELDVAPAVINDRTMLPVRAVTEALGCECEWDGDNQSITITNSFQTKRLIVKTDKNINFEDKYNASDVINMDNNMYLVQFSSIEAAKSASEELEGISDYAVPDIIETVTASRKSQDYLSWGAEFLNADTYADYASEQDTDNTVVVAVLDTGIDKSHELFEDKIISGGYNFVSGNKNTNDGDSHGTHVSGTVVDCTQGLDVKILPIKVLSDEGSGSSIGIINGIDYAVKQGADVINLSLGGRSNGIYKPYQEAIQNAVDNGVVVVTAAGNDCEDAKNHRPANVGIEGSICVAACDDDGEGTSFSNYGNTVEVAAPGYGIYSSVPDNDYDSYNGTSMAAPHISAMAAMIKIAHPYSTPAEIENALIESGEKCGAYVRGKYYGIIPDMKNVIDYRFTQNTTPAPTVKPTSKPTTAPTTEPANPTPSPTQQPSKDISEIPKKEDLIKVDSDEYVFEDNSLAWSMYTDSSNELYLFLGVVNEGDSLMLVEEIEEFGKDANYIIFEENVGYVHDDDIKYYNASGEREYIEINPEPMLDKVKAVYVTSPYTNMDIHLFVYELYNIEYVYIHTMKYRSIDGVLYRNGEESAIEFYPCNKKDKTFEIDKTAEILVTDAFEQNNYIETLIIPKNIKEVYGRAISECKNLKDIYIYNPETSISDECIVDCNDDIVIHGHKGSYAEEAAEYFGYKFEEIK